METIQVSFLELLMLAHLLYGALGLVRHRCEDGSSCIIKMSEGVNQGCPLLAIVSDLALDRMLRPLDNMLWEQAQNRVANSDYGDDRRGSVTNLR